MAPRTFDSTPLRILASAAVATLILAIPVIGGAAERIVLAEHFTNIY